MSDAFASEVLNEHRLLLRHVLERQLIERHAAPDDVRLSAGHVIHRKRRRESVRLVGHLQRERAERHSPDLVQLSPRAWPVHRRGTSDGLHCHVPDDHRRCDIDDKSARRACDRRLKCPIRSNARRPMERPTLRQPTPKARAAERPTRPRQENQARLPPMVFRSASRTAPAAKSVDRLRQRQARCVSANRPPAMR